MFKKIMVNKCISRSAIFTFNILRYRELVQRVKGDTPTVVD